MVCNPVVDGLIVLLGVNDILVDLGGVVGLARNVPGTWRDNLDAYSCENKCRCTHVDAYGKAVGVDLLSSLNIDVFGGGWRCRVEAWVMRSEFTAESYSQHP